MTDWRTDSEIEQDIASLPGDQYPDVPPGDLPFDYPLQSELDAEAFLHPDVTFPQGDFDEEDEELICPECEGSGVVLANQYTNSQEKRCPECGGEGYIS